MEWVKCSDKLPEDGVEVLVYTPITKSITVAYLTYDHDDNPIVYFIIDFDENDQNISLKDITHWMPLPEKPKD